MAPLFDLPPQPKLWTPPKPGIIRTGKDLERPKIGEKIFAPAIVGLVPVFMPGASGPQPIVLTTGGNAEASPFGNSYTFSSVSYGGAASATRRIFASILIRSGNNVTGTVTSVSIGGVSASFTTWSVTVGSSFNFCTLVLATAVVPTGTSGSVAVVWSVSDDFTAVVSLVSAEGVISGTPTNTASPSVSSNPGATIGVNAGGAIFGLCATQSATATWTGLTEKFDGSVAYFSTASSVFVTASSSSVSVVADNTGDVGLGVASFR